ncbi:MAG: cadherin domain-containing protein [Oceanobacter sp.]
MFELEDVFGDVITVLDEEYGTEGADVAAQFYGDILAALSGAENNYGSMGAMLEALAAEVVVTDGVATLTPAGGEILSAGLAAYQAREDSTALTGGSFIESIPTVEDLPEVVTLDTIETGLPLNLTDLSEGDQVVINLGGEEYSVTVTADMLESGSATINFPADQVSALSNGTQTLNVSVNGESRQSTQINLDITAPTLNISFSDTQLSIGESTTVTFTFSEEVVGFSLDDVTVESGTLSNLNTEDGITYTATYTAASNVEDANMQLSVAADSYSDTSGNRAAQQIESLNVDTKAPIFSGDDTIISINENTGGVVYTIDTDDAAATYSLGGVDADAFTLAENGKVSLKENANYEDKTSYSFHVVATDELGNSTTSETITINVTNLDEIAPVISSDTSATAVTENNDGEVVVYTAEATDSEDYVSGAVSYSLAPADLQNFRIDAETGVVTFIGQADFEVAESLSFTVTATDAAGNQTPRTVTMAVNNQDEVAPVFTSGSSATTINENVSNLVVYRAATNDSEDYVSGQVTYSLASADRQNFSINAATGVVTFIGAANHEAGASLSFTVTATDAAGNQTPRTVTMAINDLDESAPEFVLTQLVEQGEIVESYQNVTETFNLQAGVTYRVDLEGAASGKGTLADPYLADIFDPNGVDLDVYNDDVSKGNPNAQLVFTPEVTGEYQIVAAGGEGGSIGTYTLTVTPTVSIDENSAIGTSVFVSTATDTADVDDEQDTSSQITYSLSEEDQANFNIDSETGEITLAVVPDYEVQSSYDIDLIATDLAGNSTTQTINLTVNNLPPTVTLVGSEVSSSESGSWVYLVNSEITVETWDDIRNADSSLWVGVGPEGREAGSVDMDTSSLAFGEYYAYAVDDEGAVSQPSTNTLTVLEEVDVLIDLVNGISTLDSDNNRVFDADKIYTIYMKVDADSSILALDADHVWSGAENLGADDRIILISDDGSEVVARSGGTVNAIGTSSGLSWSNSDDESTAFSMSESGLLNRAANDRIRGNSVTWLAEGESITVGGEEGVNAGLTSADIASVYSTEMPDLNLHYEVDVLVDFVNGTSSLDLDGNREFDINNTYTIYMQVDSDSTALTMLESQYWSGAENLGADDRIILVGDGSEVENANGVTVGYFGDFNGFSWSGDDHYSAFVVSDGAGYVTRAADGGRQIADWADSGVNFSGEDAVNSGAEELSDLYLTSLPDYLDIKEESNILIDFVEGTSSLDLDGDREFDANTTYTIYMKVDADSAAITMAEDQYWSGADNLGTDDRIILVSDDGTEVIDYGGDPVDTYLNLGEFAWGGTGDVAVGVGGNGSIYRVYDGVYSGSASWLAADSGTFDIRGENAVNAANAAGVASESGTYLTSLPDLDFRYGANILIDFTTGTSSVDLDGDREFDANTTYTIYMKVDSDSANMLMSESQLWSGAENLGADDRIILVGDSEDGSGVRSGTSDYDYYSYYSGGESAAYWLDDDFDPVFLAYTNGTVYRAYDGDSTTSGWLEEGESLVTGGDGAINTYTGTDLVSYVYQDQLSDSIEFQQEVNVLLDFVAGSSTLDSDGDRAFDADKTYTIYMKVDADSVDMTMLESQYWSGAENLGADDRIILVSDDGTGVIAYSGEPVDNYYVYFDTALEWSADYPAVTLYDGGSVLRSFDGDDSGAANWLTDDSGTFVFSGEGAVNSRISAGDTSESGAYLSSLPDDVVFYEEVNVLVDFVNGTTSVDSDGDREFDPGISYVIYLQVDSDAAELTMDASQYWSGAENLGADDRIVLVGDDSSQVISQGLLHIDKYQQPLAWGNEADSGPTVAMSTSGLVVREIQLDQGSANWLVEGQSITVEGDDAVNSSIDSSSMNDVYQYIFPEVPIYEDSIEEVNVLVDFVNGGTSLDSDRDREFDADKTYTIYMKVDADSSDLKYRMGQLWTGAENLGADDRIVLLSDDGTGVIARNGLAISDTSLHTSEDTSALAWFAESDDGDGVFSEGEDGFFVLDEIEGSPWVGPVGRTYGDGTTDPEGSEIGFWLNPFVDQTLNLTGDDAVNSGLYDDAAANGTYLTSLPEGVTFNEEVCVLVDFIRGVTTLDNDGDRVFEADTTYTIYLQVDSDSDYLTMMESQYWSGVENLGEDDRIVLVGDDGSVVETDDESDVTSISISDTAIEWTADQDDVALSMSADGTVTRYLDSDDDEARWFSDASIALGGIDTVNAGAVPDDASTESGVTRFDLDGTELYFDEQPDVPLNHEVDVRFDFLNGFSTLDMDEDREFNEDVTYNIYMLVDSDSNTLNFDDDFTWSGAANLGSDDRIILVGDDGPVQTIYIDGDGEAEPKSGEVDKYQLLVWSDHDFDDGTMVVSGGNGFKIFSSGIMAGLAQRTTKDGSNDVEWLSDGSDLDFTAVNASQDLSELYLTSMPLDLNLFGEQS